jgi:hypothetical protein
MGQWFRPNLIYDHNSKISMFYKGLHQDIKDSLIYFPEPQTFEELVDQCITIDQRRYAHRKAGQRAEKSSKSQSKPPNNNNNNPKKPEYPK